MSTYVVIVYFLAWHSYLLILESRGVHKIVVYGW